MSLKVGKGISVATNFVKSNPAIPVYRGEESFENLYAVIYHIEIGYNKNEVQEILQYLIIDYKDYNLSDQDKDEILDIVDDYCEKSGIEKNDNLKIKLLDDEVAENFVEKVFNNMKIIRGLISKEG